MIGKLSDSSRSQNSSGVNLNVGRKGVLKELQQVLKWEEGAFSALSLLALHQALSLVLIIDLFLLFEYAWSSTLGHK